MEKKEKYVQDEETTVLKDSRTIGIDSAGTEGTETIQPGKGENAEDGKKSPAQWKQVSIGAASGILIGVAGVLFSSSAIMEDDADGDQNETVHHSGASGAAVSEDYQLDSVSDDMTFSDAFAAARAELGPGGVFEWHGNLYTTDTVEEWNAAHPQTTSADDEADMEVEVAGDSDTADAADASDSEDSEDVEVEVAADDEVEDVEVIGVLDTSDEDAEIHAEVLNMDGEEVLVVDMDNDGEYDALVSDISDMHLTDDDLSAMAYDDSTDMDAAADDCGTDLM